MLICSYKFENVTRSNTKIIEAVAFVNYEIAKDSDHKEKSRATRLFTLFILALD